MTFEELVQQVSDLANKLEELRLLEADDIKTHQHDGLLSSRTNFQDLLGGLQTTSAVPTDTPRDIFDWVRVYKSGSSYRLYVYDGLNNVWKYANIVTPLSGTKVYYVSDTSGGAVTRKLTFTDGILTAET